MSELGTNQNIRKISEKLLLYEAAEPAPSQEHTSAAAEVCQKLTHPLSQLIGEAGYRALLQRALTLAKREEEVLRPVQVAEGGALEGMTGQSQEASIVAHLIDLLITFLGEALTLRLLYGIWPDRSFSDVHFRERNGNESA